MRVDLRLAVPPCYALSPDSHPTVAQVSAGYSVESNSLLKAVEDGRSIICSSLQKDDFSTGRSAMNDVLDVYEFVIAINVPETVGE